MMTEEFCGHVQANKALAVNICKTNPGEKTVYSTKYMPVVEQYIAGFQCLLYDLILFYEFSMHRIIKNPQIYVLSH